MTSEYIFAEVERIHKKYETRDPFELLDDMGAITIISREFGRNGLKGYSTVARRFKYAVINGYLHEYERRIVAGHEAAHLTIHVDEITHSPLRALRDFSIWDNSGRIEYQANLFLADFLLPDDEVMEAIKIEESDYFAASCALYVPPPLLAFKLYSMMRRGYAVRPPVDLDSKFLGE